jgi:hypothetical protein
VERREITVIRAGDRIAQRCQTCGSNAGLMRAEDAATVLGVDLSQILRWMEEGRIHGCTTPEGQVQICAKTLQ